MEKFIQMRNQKLSERVIKALATRNMEGYYVNTKEEALEKALELIPEGSSVSWGGAMSAKGIGLTEELYRKGSYVIVDRDKAKTPEEVREKVLAAFDVDFYIGGVNAMTEDGVLVNVDGYSNRVAAYCHGPRNLLLVVSMKKVVKTLDGAMERARCVAAPINVQRFDRDTPCAKTGTCADCKNPDCICSNVLITRFSHVPNRVKIILVNEDLGF